MTSFLTRWRRQWMLTCKEVNGFLEAYLDDSLDPDTQAQFERHIQRCETCRTYLEQYRTTIALVKEADPAADSPVPPEPLVKETLAFVRDHYDASPPNHFSS